MQHTQVGSAHSVNIMRGDTTVPNRVVQGVGNVQVFMYIITSTQGLGEIRVIRVAPQGCKSDCGRPETKKFKSKGSKDRALAVVRDYITLSLSTECTWGNRTLQPL